MNIFCDFLNIYLKQGGTVVQWLVLSLHCKKVQGLIPGSGSFCAEFACSPCACVCSLWVLLLPPTVQNMQTGVRLVGRSKLSVSADGFLSLHVSPAMTWRLVQGDPTFTPRWKMDERGFNKIHRHFTYSLYSKVLIYTFLYCVFIYFGTFYLFAL